MRNPCGVWWKNLSLLAGCGLSLLGCSDDSHRLGGAPEPRPVRLAERVGTCAAGDDLELLDSMEDGDGAIEMTERRGGVWFSFHDETVGGYQFPASNEETFVMTELEVPRAGSHYAARSYGGAFTDWGAGIGFEIYNQKAYDLSAYAGITFFARRGPLTASALRFAVTDSATTPRGGQCLGKKKCSDHFGVNITLGTAFRRYSFAWDELKQEGWGEPHPDAVNASAVYGVRFQIDPLEDFDFWIDDVALLCRPE